MSAVPVLVSHALCPYVQRAAIVLAEKGLPFERRDIDLGNKPDWFRKLSPTGKTPMLLVDGYALFESAAICEYLDETALPRLHPANALQRARHRAWMEFGSGVLDRIGSFYRATDDAQLHQRAGDIRARFVALEEALAGGPCFDGPFSIVDAVFGPVFRYFDVFETVGEFGFFHGLPKVRAWRRTLSERPRCSRPLIRGTASSSGRFSSTSRGRWPGGCRCLRFPCDVPELHGLGGLLARCRP